MVKRFSKWDWAAFAIIVFGAGLRLYPLFIFPIDEPFRLGGLFYEFSNQIVLNNFVFPETIPYYSAGGIPFAYPPLSFYMQAILIHLFNPALFFTVNLLPPLITILTLPAFYWMIQQYTDNHQLAIAGLFAYALMPAAFINQIEAAGLAEALGSVALILYLGLLLRWTKHPNWKNTILAGLALGFCVLSSPGSAYAATLFSVIFFIWTSIQGLIKRILLPTGMLIILGVIGLIISAPYWLSVLQNHGGDFFITPFLGQHQSSVSPGQIQDFISFQPAGISLGFIWNWLIFAGLIWAIVKRHLLIIVIFFMFWLIPREGIWLVSIPAAILAGMGIVFILLPLFAKVFQTTSATRPPLAPGIFGVILLILVIANAFFTINVSITEPTWRVSRSQIDSLLDFQDEIPDNGRVIILGNIGLAEWAPAILQREILNIEYGLEWQPTELEKVQAINVALEEGDLGGMINALEAYTGDHLVYLVSTTDDLKRYRDTMPQNTTLRLIKSTPTLNLYILRVK